MAEKASRILLNCCNRKNSRTVTEFQASSKNHFRETDSKLLVDGEIMSSEDPQRWNRFLVNNLSTSPEVDYKALNKLLRNQLLIWKVFSVLVKHLYMSWFKLWWPIRYLSEPKRIFNINLEYSPLRDFDRSIDQLLSWFARPATCSPRSSERRRP